MYHSVGTNDRSGKSLCISWWVYRFLDKILRIRMLSRYLFHVKWIYIIYLFHAKWIYILQKTIPFEDYRVQWLSTLAVSARKNSTWCFETRWWIRQRKYCGKNFLWLLNFQLVSKRWKIGYLFLVPGYSISRLIFLHFASI